MTTWDNLRSAEWRPYEPERRRVLDEIPMDPEHLMRACYDLIGYDLNHGIESDATVVATEDREVCATFLNTPYPCECFMSPREARVLAARLLRAATAAEIESTVWKFKKLEGVERVGLAKPKEKP